MATFPLPYGYNSIWDEDKIYPQSPANLVDPAYQRQQMINQASGLYNADRDSFGNVIQNTDMYGRSAEDIANQRAYALANAQMTEPSGTDYGSGLSYNQAQIDSLMAKEKQNQGPLTSIFGNQPFEDYKGKTVGEAFQVAGKKINEADPTGIVGVINPLEDIGTAINYVTDDELRNDLLQKVKENPATTTLATLTAYAAAKSKKAKKAWDAATKRYKGQKARLKYNKDGKPTVLKEAVKGKSVLGDAAKIYVGTKLGSEVLKEQGIATPSLMNQGTTDTQTTDATTQTNVAGQEPPKDVNTRNEMARDAISKNPNIFGGILKQIPGGAGGWDTPLYRLGELMAYFGTPLAQRKDAPSKRWQGLTEKAMEQENKLAMKGLELKSKEKGYNWKAKEIADYASNYFDSYFGTDFPIFGKDKEIERNRFITAVADTKKLPGNENVPLQDIIDEVLKKGNFR